MFDISISLKDSKVFGGFVIDSYFFEPSKYEYAFRLIRVFDDGKIDKVDAKRYSDKKNVIFNASDISGIFYIRCFLRDKENRDVRTFNSEKLVIN